MTRVSSLIDRIQAKLESIFDAPCACAAAVEEMVDEGLLSNSLTFDQFRIANDARTPVFKNRKGEPTNSGDWIPAQWFQAFVGEVGEYANWRKKYEHGDITHDQFMVEARKELADAQTYLDKLASCLGIDLGEATREKFNEISKRVGVDIFL